MELLGLHQRNARGRPRIERGLLMRIFAVPKILHFGQIKMQTLGQDRLSIARSSRGYRASDLRCKVLADRRVVPSRRFEALQGQLQSKVLRGSAVGLKLGQDRSVLRRAGRNGDKGVILRRGSDQTRTPDVDLLDRFAKTHSLFGYRCLERIQIDDDQIDRLDRVRRERPQILLVISAGKNPAEDFRMQRLDPPVHDLGKPGVLGHFEGHNPVICKEPVSPACAVNLHAPRRETFGKLGQTRLVAYADQCPSNR